MTDESNLIRTAGDQLLVAQNQLQLNLRARTLKGLEVIREENDLGGGFGMDDAEVEDFETKDSGLNDRLDLFINDVDNYSGMLIQLEKEGGDEEMPAELLRVLVPVKEKS